VVRKRGIIDVSDDSWTEIRLSDETVPRDVNSPLYLIREKELELSGKVFAIKREAEEIVAEARKRAAETVLRAEQKGLQMAEEQKRQAFSEIEQQIDDLRGETLREIEALRLRAKESTEAAASYIVGIVTRA